MHFIIVEDQEADRARLAELIRQDCGRWEERAAFTCCASGEEFLSRYRPGCCSAVFLDILLGGVTGLEAARRVREREPRLPIIFTTTEPDFALESYAVHAMDYLLKPVAPEKVSWCMKELRSYLAAPTSVPLQETSAWGHASPVDVPFDEILYAQYGSHIVDVHTTLGVFCTRRSFREFMALLPQTGQFYECGRGLVVNLTQVMRVKDEGLLLKNGELVPYSRRRKQEIAKAFTEWAFACARKGGWA